MPDLPDWYRFLGDSARYAIGDLGELAARLGSPSVFERLGEVVWFDDISNGLAPWQTSYSGAGGSFKVVVDPVMQGGYSIEMIGGSDEDKRATMERYFSPLEISRIGVEVSVSFNGDFDYFDVAALQFFSTTYAYALFRIDYTNSSLKVWTPDGFTEFATLSNFANYHRNFHNLKLVADFDALEYVRLMFNETNHNISAHSLRTGDLEGEEYITMYLRIGSRAGQNDDCHVGRVIITANEP